MTKTHCFAWVKTQTWDQKRFYTTYINIKGRCNNESNKCYMNYGWRGIKCLWESFEEFRDDMWESYKDHVMVFGSSNTSIDRIDVNWNYCKENCKRSTRREQWNNKRNNKIAIIDGREYSATDLRIILWIGEWAAQNRITQYLNGKMSKERMFTKEKLFQPRKKYDIDGELYDVHRLMEECGITLSAAEHRLRDYVKWKISKDILFHSGNYRYRQS